MCLCTWLAGWLRSGCLLMRSSWLMYLQLLINKLFDFSNFFQNGEINTEIFFISWAWTLRFGERQQRERERDTHILRGNEIAVLASGLVDKVVWSSLESRRRPCYLIQVWAVLDSTRLGCCCFIHLLLIMASCCLKWILFPCQSKHRELPSLMFLA